MHFTKILEQIASHSISNNDFWLLQEFADALPFGVYIRELVNFNFIFVNRKLTDILGFSKEELIGHNFFMMPSNQIIYNDKLVEKLSPQIGKLQKVKIKDKNGNVVNMIHSFELLEDDNKNLYRLGVLISAVDSLEKTFFSLFTKNFELEEFLEFIKVPIALIDRKLNQIIFANSSLADFVKIKNKSDVIDTVNSIFCKNEFFYFHYKLFISENLDFFEFITNIVDTENNSIQSLCILNKLPDFNHDLLCIHPILSSSNNIVTSLVDKSENYVNDNLLKSNFITLVSHEFRTPLTKILLATDLLMNYEEKMSREEKLNHFVEIKDTIYGMTKLMEAVMTVSKMEQNLYKLEYEMIDLRLFFEMILDGFIVRNNKGLVYNFNFSAVSRFVPIEMTLMTLICNNLIDNATKFSKPNTIIDISISTNLENNINIEIKDNGIGIPENEIEMVFKSFYKSSNNKNYEGYGLGLFIVKKSLDLLNGRISIKSELDKGTIVQVTIPAPHQTRLQSLSS